MKYVLQPSNFWDDPALPLSFCIRLRRIMECVIHIPMKGPPSQITDPGRNRRRDVKLAGTYRKISGDKCIYCGDPFEHMDHFYPVSQAANSKVHKSKRLLVPSCADCNMIAKNRAFNTLAEKRKFIRDRILRKYKDVISTHWTEDELEDIGWMMKHQIQKQMKLRSRVLERLKWLGVQSVGTPSLRNALGNGSVPESVASCITLKGIERLGPTSNRKLCENCNLYYATKRWYNRFCRKPCAATWFQERRRTK